MILTLKSAKNQNKTVGIKLCLISNNIIRQRFSVFLSEEAQQILKTKKIVKQLVKFGMDRGTTEEYTQNLETYKMVLKNQIINV